MPKISQIDEVPCQAEVRILQKITLKMFKIRGPWDGKKNLYLVCRLTPSSFQICKEVQKPCCGRGPGWLPFLVECPKYIFFSCLTKLHKFCLGVELDPAHHVIKKLKMDHFWVYTLYPNSCLNGYIQNVIKKQKGHVSYWNSEYTYLIEKWTSSSNFM